MKLFNCFVLHSLKLFIATSLVLLLISYVGLTHAAPNSSNASSLVPVISLLLGDEYCRGELEDLIEMQPNLTLRIECRYDLKLASVALPVGTRLEFAGGSIINGSLVFSGGVIESALLNHRLEVVGDVELDDPVFTFNPTNWGIRQGRVNRASALTNRVNINKAIDQVQRLGAHTMELGKIDAYFEVGWRRGNRLEQSRVSIRVPSNFHFKMSNETYLRVQPTDQPAYSLVNVYNTVNSTVSGGHLVGDRYEHNYVPVNISGAHEFGSCLYVIGSHNTLVENVEAYHAIGEGLFVHAEGPRKPDGTLPPGVETTENLLVKGGIYRDNRRNNIAVADADGVVFDDITVLRAGEGNRPPGGPDSSAGVQPWAAIDLEATRTERDGEANKITDITIRNSTLRDNVRGLVVHTPSNVLIENNTFINDAVGSRASFDVTIKDNVFTSLNDKKPVAINIQRFVSALTGEQLVHDWRVLGNTITGYPNAIVVGGESHTVSGNKLYENLTGIKMDDLSDSTISGNTIESSVPNSKGHYPGGSGTMIQNVLVKNETILVAHRPIDLQKINTEINDTNRIDLTIEDSDLRTTGNWPVYIKDSKNIMIRNSTYTNDIDVLESENIILEDNTLVVP